MAVRNSKLLHGEDNEAYFQRADQRLLTKGRSGAAKAEKETPTERVNVREYMHAPIVLSEEAMLAVWS